MSRTGRTALYNVVDLAGKRSNFKEDRLAMIFIGLLDMSKVMPFYGPSIHSSMINGQTIKIKSASVLRKARISGHKYYYYIEATKIFTSYKELSLRNRRLLIGYTVRKSKGTLQMDADAATYIYLLLLSKNNARRKRL